MCMAPITYYLPISIFYWQVRMFLVKRVTKCLSPFAVGKPIVSALKCSSKHPFCNLFLVGHFEKQVFFSWDLAWKIQTAFKIKLVHCIEMPIDCFLPLTCTIWLASKRSPITTICIDWNSRYECTTYWSSFKPSTLKIRVQIPVQAKSFSDLVHNGRQDFI